VCHRIACHQAPLHCPTKSCRNKAGDVADRFWRQWTRPLIVTRSPARLEQSLPLAVQVKGSNLIQGHAEQSLVKVAEQLLISLDGFGSKVLFGVSFHEFLE